MAINITPDQLKKILIENNINKACQVFPHSIQEGALCLTKEEDTWVVSLNERGVWRLKEKFWVESDACKYFLKKVLSDPTYRNDFKQTDLLNLEEYQQKLLAKYDL